VAEKQNAEKNVECPSFKLKKRHNKNEEQIERVYASHHAS
jgi:hypothetical protein